MTAYKFGTVFRYNDDDYIWLVEDKDQIYAAKILNLRDSKTLNDLFLRRYGKNPNSSILSGLQYSFVILETKELKDRVASFLPTGHERLNSLFLTILDITLCQKDLKALKEEITKERCAIIKLRELVKGMDI